ncbi:PREDICTED: uncharacterized protein LOC108445358 [Corvus brachyrhynchos]|uniref:uncharacterized protein LOC108445358 n=1 Tax=Corvus brachyrhynchos TaxID=85066 RepID=UPI0008167264|nr:PREDICTED: uncharacterized protein LOC108445358 [Corvus brachyrhynchos]
MGAKGSKPSVPMGRVPAGRAPVIPQNTPLAFMLNNWKYLPSSPGKHKARMIEFCTKIWGGKKIQKNVIWPVFGSDEDWVRQQLNLWVNSKSPLDPEESAYAAMWLEKPQVAMFPLNERKKERKEEQEDELLLNPPPYVPPAQAPEAPPPPIPLDAPINAERVSPITVRRRTRNQREQAQMYPLREVPMGGPLPGIGYVTVPLNSGDLREFKRTEMGSLLDDPLGVAERLDQFLGPSLYTWGEMNSILSQLFTSEEKEMIRRAGMRIWDARHAQGPQADTKWPLQNPNWDNQNAEHRVHMGDLRTIVIQGIREAVPRGQNISKAFNDRQRKDESPTEWLERLRKALQLYSRADPASPLGQAVLKTHFVAKSWDERVRRTIERSPESVRAERGREQ